MNPKESDLIRNYLSYVTNLNYKEKPPTMKEFLSNPQYLGNLTNNGKAVYPVWKDTLELVAKEDSKYMYVLTGAIGIGKSFCAVYGMLYVMCRILCLRDPWAYFGRAKGSQMSIVFFNLTKGQSESTAYKLFQNCLVNSPWFKERGILGGSELNPKLEFPLFKYTFASPFVPGFGCLTGDTQVSLLDGRELTIPEIQIEMENGKQLWAYSYDTKEEKMVPGKITFAGKTKENAQLVRVTLDNGEHIDCTPDHPFMLRDGTYKEAQYLTVNESLMPLYRKLGEEKKNHGIVSVEVLNWTEDVYDITVEGQHNFATTAGVFVHNSQGEHIICALLDEVDSPVASEVQREKVISAYENARRRLDSRFVKHGETIGRFFLVASKQQRLSFLNTFISKYKNSKSVHIVDVPIWLARERTEFSKEEFLVSCGDVYNSPKILTDKIDIETSVRKGFQVIKVPMDYYDSFAKDIVGCLGGETKISLLDGSEVCIKDLIGKEEFWVYSVDKEGNIKPGRGFDARLTGKQQDVFEVELDNGEKITCTGNHPFMLRDGTYKEAQHLQPNESLMPFYTKFPSKGNLQEYKMIYCPSNGWHFIHRLVSGKLKKGQVVHHKDFNPINNSPENLQVKYHMKLGRKVGFQKGHILTKAQIAYLETLSKKMKENNIAKDPKSREKIRKNNIKVKNVKFLGKQDVYDISVEKYHNFALTSGVFVHNSLRDIAGVSVSQIRATKLFPSESILTNCFTQDPNPVSKATIEIGLQDEAVDLLNFIDFKAITVSRSIPRFIHVDYAFSGDGDALGIGMSCIKGWIEQNTENSDGTFSVEKVPLVHTDFGLRIKAPPGDKLPLHKIRKLILDIKLLQHFQIGLVTFDLRIATEGDKQILERRGIPCDWFSMDKNPQFYREFRNIASEGRWTTPWHPYLYFELKNLEDDNDLNKIDHPAEVVEVEFLEDGNTREIILMGSKDIADGVAGSVCDAIQHCITPVDTKVMQDLFDKVKPKIGNPTENYFNLLKLDGVTKESQVQNNDILKQQQISEYNKLLGKAKSYQKGNNNLGV